MSKKKSSKSKRSKSSKKTPAQASLSNMWNKTKKFTKETKKSFDQRMTMEGLLGQARISLEHYLDPKVIPAEERMSRDILRNAKGIALISEAKGGFIVGVKGGSGIILVKKNTPTKKKKNSKNKKAAWSSPCAVGTGGISFGLLAGATKVDHIVILSTQDQVDVFFSKGQLQLKGNTNATVAKWGRNADAGVSVGSDNKAAPIFTYSFGVKGLFGGISLDGEVLCVRKDCNEHFYKKTVHVKDILCGAVPMPKKNKDYNIICKLLNDYCKSTDDDQKNDGFGMDFPIQPIQHGHGHGQAHNVQNKNMKRNVNMKNKGNQNNNNYNQAAMRSVSNNPQVHSAAKSAARDKNVQRSAYNAYKSGGNDPNANRKLIGSMAKNKQVQGAAVSVAQDKNVQRAAYNTAKNNVNQNNAKKAKQMMLPKPNKPKKGGNYSNVVTDDYV